MSSVAIKNELSVADVFVSARAVQTKLVEVSLKIRPTPPQKKIAE